MRDSNLRFIGLDLETSGTSHEKSAPIEVGLATDAGLTFGTYIGGWEWEDELDLPIARPIGKTYEWSMEAMGVHGIDRGMLIDAPPASHADAGAVSWLKSQLPDTEPKGIIAVGWNVAAFDFPFVRMHLPRLAQSMSYRSVDLNAIVFAITQAGLPDSQGRPWDYYGLKSYVKSMAAEMIRENGVEEAQWGEEAWHQADYDALAGLYAFFMLQEVLHVSA